jgi:hypothetical protein
MKKALLSLLFTVGVANVFAANKSFTVALANDSVIDGDAVKAGTYKVASDGGEATFEQDGHVVTVHAHEVAAAKKFDSTELVYEDNNMLKEIHVAGTKIDLVIDSATNIQPGT